MAKIPHSAHRTGAYCTICGDEESTWSPIRYWSPDDGWMIGALCESCIEHYAARPPKPTDYAYAEHRDEVCSQELADEDPTIALL